jgi:hypothetical protein
MRTGAIREFGLVAALLALWTLTLHAVLPGMDLVPAAGQVICTLQGAQPGPQSPAMPAADDCGRHCLAVAGALPDPPRPAARGLVWRAPDHAGPTATPVTLARLSPRPPGQGPPLA